MRLLGQVGWLDTADHGFTEFTTRHANEALIATKILPALGSVPARKLTVETLERFYAVLRKRGGAEGRPLSGSTVRRFTPCCAPHSSGR